MGMNKNADQAVNAGATNARLAGWTARSGYGGTIISANNELISASTGAVIVHCSVQLKAAWSPQYGALHLMLMLNDSELKSADFATNATSLTLQDVQVTLQPGDRVWVQMNNTTSVPWSTNATVQGGATTYVSFDAA
ncbi:hypothetical protein [Nocardia sp. NBC_01327]|uniref:hypothetical protein n=1 Tax=Nocardia sp. NBC_01327 TaxID=2903593 RepID=UPI002E14E8A5|nr:hypothetical protein OG326_02930 [Nocardia sp. NBC_01327]